VLFTGKRRKKKNHTRGEKLSAGKSSLSELGKKRTAKAPPEKKNRGKGKKAREKGKKAA